MKERNAALEAEIEEVEAAEEAEREAALAASGPPKCETCGQEKVLLPGWAGCARLAGLLK